MPEHVYTVYGSEAEGQPYEVLEQNILSFHGAMLALRDHADKNPDLNHFWVEDENCEVIWFGRPLRVDI